MKKIAFGIACGLTALFVFVIMLTAYGRSARQEEANRMLSQAIDSTLSSVMSENNYTIETNEDFIADFLKALLIQANSDSDITVSVLDADYAMGILSVEITEKYKHPNGNEGSVSEVRTVIFDKAVEQEEEGRTVSFYVSDEMYKEYNLQKNSVCSLPVPPEKEGKIFRCWRFISGALGEAESINMQKDGTNRNVLAVNGAPYLVSEDTKLTAVFE